MNLIFTSELKPTEIFPPNLVDAILSPRKLACVKCYETFSSGIRNIQTIWNIRKIHYSSRFAQWEAKFNNMPVYPISYIENISVFLVT